MPSNDPAQPKSRNSSASRQAPPELYQVVVECRDEAHQRELFERLKREGMKVRLLVL
jgi:hypothetical protein